jgi:type I restriction enzyme, S subunit
VTDVNTLITEHLDIWTTAIVKKSGAGRRNGGVVNLYGINKLRELILELAVRGKLVPQDEGEEPAKGLLDRLRIQQVNMYAEGLIKKPKRVLKIEESETPFELPSGWSWCRVSQLGHDWGQKTPDSSFTYIDVGSINKELGLVTEPKVLAADEAPSRARKLVRNGTVIYSTVRPYLLNIAVVTEDFDPEPIASTAFAIVNPFEGVSASYLYRYFRSPTFVAYVEGCQTGIAYPAINDKQFFLGLVPLPPTAEQHRIVTKVDELMALCDALEMRAEDSLKAHQTLVETCLATLINSQTPENLSQNWARLEANFEALFTTEESITSLRRTIIELAVQGRLVSQNAAEGDATKLLESVERTRRHLVKNKKVKNKKDVSPVYQENFRFPLPSGWVWTRLSALAEIGPRNALDDDTVVSFVPMPDVHTAHNGEHDHSERRWGEIKKSYTHFADGDVALAKITPCFENSKAAVFSGLHNGVGAGTTELHVARLYSENVLARFIILHLKTPSFLENGKTVMTGSAGQKRVPRWYFSDTPIALPPTAEQHRIVARVDELMALCDNLSDKISSQQARKKDLADTLLKVA